jgi:ATP-binding cassette, subfamily B, bacterial
MTLTADLPAPPRRPRLVRQLELGDCGAACLASVLRAHGRDVPLSELRDLSATGPQGVSALGLVHASRALGFDAVGLRVPAERLGDLPSGSILHWRRNHFVVLVGRGRRGLHVLDPALGERVVPAETVAEQYSGVAVVVTPPRPDASASASAERTVRPHTTVVRWHRYRPFLAGARRPITFALACAVVVQGFLLVHPFVLRRVVDDRDSIDVATFALGVAALAVGFLAAQLGRLAFLLVLQRTVDVHLTLGVLRHLVALPWSFLARRSTGDLALRLRSTVAVRQVLTSAALSTLLDGSLVVAYVVLIAVVDVPFALLTLAALALQVGVVVLSWGQLRLAAAETLEAQSAAQAKLLEIVGGLDVLKASGAARSAVEGWAADLDREVRAQARSARASGVVETVLLTVRFLVPPALLVLGLVRLRSGALDLGDMLALATLSAAVTVPTGSLLATVCTLSTVAGYLERLDDLLASKVETAGPVAVPDRLRGELTLEAVSYRYSPLLPPALADVDLVVEPGEHLAVVGPSGSGKSTLALVLATLLTPTTGVVSVDGVDVADYDVDALRQRVGVVTQETTLFAATIRDNVRFGREWVSDDDVVHACRLAALADEIDALPNGYDTVLGTAGRGLSGGQRQRLAIARAVAGRPSVLVLDEATSALDALTEQRVHDGLATLSCTRVVVAHRLATVARADRLVVLAAGRVEAVGTLASLRRTNAHVKALTSAGTQKAAAPKTAAGRRQR